MRGKGRPRASSRCGEGRPRAQAPARPGRRLAGPRDGRGLRRGRGAGPRDGRGLKRGRRGRVAATLRRQVGRPPPSPSRARRGRRAGEGRERRARASAQAPSEPQTPSERQARASTETTLLSTKGPRPPFSPHSGEKGGLTQTPERTVVSAREQGAEGAVELCLAIGDKAQQQALAPSVWQSFSGHIPEKDCHTRHGALRPSRALGERRYGPVPRELLARDGTVPSLASSRRETARPRPSGATRPIAGRGLTRWRLRRSRG